MAKGKVEIGPTEPVFTTNEVARICNVASRTAAKWFDSGLLVGYRIPGSKDRRIPQPSLLAFMKKNKIPVPDGLESEDK